MHNGIAMIKYRDRVEREEEVDSGEVMGCRFGIVDRIGDLSRWWLYRQGDHLKEKGPGFNLTPNAKSTLTILSQTNFACF